MVLGQRTAITWDPWRAQFSPVSRRKPEIAYDMWADFMTSLPRPDDPWCKHIVAAVQILIFHQ